MEQKQEPIYEERNDSGVASSGSGTDTQSSPRRDEDSGINTPEVNSSSKKKKCKHCSFVAVTKPDYWTHARTHIDPKKLFLCPQCPFVTQYKHHLGYHMKRHSGCKSFKCDKCNYSCINQSMLTSHKKLHSNIYQYGCNNCPYATKYCHELKRHLRKYSHNPAPVLNPDGTVNPFVVIDVYGTKRGPKTKSMIKYSTTDNLQEKFQNPLTQSMSSEAEQSPLQFGKHSASYFYNNGNKDVIVNEEHLSYEQTNSSETSNMSVLDLTKRISKQRIRNCRKGKPHKLYIIKQKLDDEDTEEQKEEENIRLNEISNDASTNFPTEKNMEIDEAANDRTINMNDNICQFCYIKFYDEVRYTMHMDYHDFKERFTCIKCGDKCVDCVEFLLHTSLCHCQYISF